jgi:hypothetical protein
VCSVKLEKPFSVFFLNIGRILNSESVTKRTHWKCYTKRTFPNSLVKTLTKERDNGPASLFS